MRETLGQWARAAKAKTDSGAMLFWDSELWPKPKWKIDSNGVRVTSANITLFFGELSEFKCLPGIKKRALFLIEAP